MTAIKIEGLSKQFRLGVTHAGSIRELSNQIISAIFRKSNRDAENSIPFDADDDRVDGKTFWALKDINLEIGRGEVVGIIGKNGAGKSTLLKILSRITSPTTGRAVLNGRVASLLEVGTGFHPELTGRENVYLNGTILGMSRAEVAGQFDDIVKFAGVAKFIDTPVKRYSSGMMVRLGFAVAAHLNPEILIVDEVLAVGDVEFQKRCLSKMQNVAESGKTVLFVSHNLASIRSLTQRCVVLSKGKIVFDGETEKAVITYVQENLIREDAATSIADAPRPFGNLDRKLEFVDLSLIGQEEDGTLATDRPYVLSARIRANENVGEYLVGLTIYTNDKTPVGSTFSKAITPPPSNSEVTLELQADFPLAPGSYHCAISISDAQSEGKRLHDSLAEVLPFSVTIPATDLRGWHSSWGSVRLNQLIQCKSKSVNCVER